MHRSNRIAIVTGGSQGIGLAIALKLAQQDYQVIIADIAPFKEDAFKELSLPALTPEFMCCDISKETDVHHMISQIEQKFGGVDILVNNAGIISKGSLTDISIDEWNRVFSINVNGPFMLSKTVLPLMQKQKWGRIVNIASVAAQVGGGFLGNTCYAASKGAVLSLTKGIAREYASYNITCNAICPGFVETHLTLAMPKEQVEQALQGIPAHRPASPSEIGDAVVFLASSQSSYINGVTLNIDGGLIRY